MLHVILLYQVTHAAICTHCPLEYFSDPGYTQSFSRHNFPPRRGLGADIRTPWLWLTLRTNREELETFHVGSEI